MPISPYSVYLFDEASSGTSPTTIHDSASGPVNCAINYGGTTAWTSIAAGSGLFGGGSDPYGHFSARLDTTKFATSFNGAQKQTFEFVLGTTADEHFGNSWFTIGDTENYGHPTRVRVSVSYGFLFESDDLGGISWRWHYANDQDLTDGTVAHYVLVIDTTLATAADRIKLFINGTLTSPSGTNVNPTLNSSFTIASSTEWLGFGGEHHNGGSHGTVYFAALYADAMGATQAAANATALLANNDTDPNGSGSVAAASDLPWGAIRAARNTLLRM